MFCFVFLETGQCQRFWTDATDGSVKTFAIQEELIPIDTHGDRDPRKKNEEEGKCSPTIPANRICLLLVLTLIIVQTFTALPRTWYEHRGSQRRVFRPIFNT